MSSSGTNDTDNALLTSMMMGVGEVGLVDGTHLVLHDDRVYGD